MNFITKKILAKAGETLLENVVTHLSAKSDLPRSCEAVAEYSDYRYMLFAKIKGSELKKNFEITDVDGNIKYKIKTVNGMVGQPYMNLLDSNNNKIGKISKRKVRFASKRCWEKYALYLDGEELGEVERKISIGLDLTATFNNWKIKGAFNNSFYEITNAKGNIVMRIDKAYEGKMSYVLQYHNKQNEILGILLFFIGELSDFCYNQKRDV